MFQILLCCCLVFQEILLYLLPSTSIFIPLPAYETHYWCNYWYLLSVLMKQSLEPTLCERSGADNPKLREPQAMEVICSICWFLILVPNIKYYSVSGVCTLLQIKTFSPSSDPRTSRLVWNCDEKEKRKGKGKKKRGKIWKPAERKEERGKQKEMRKGKKKKKNGNRGEKKTNRKHRCFWSVSLHV